VPTSAILEEQCRQEEIWEATKGNATYVEVMKRMKKGISPPAHDFNNLWVNIATFCLLIFTLFGEGCNLYWSVFYILKILNHPLCMQNKQAYTPEVCHCITWAIIMDTCSFFDDIKLAEDFLEQGESMRFPASILEGEYMSIKHGTGLGDAGSTGSPRGILPRKRRGGQLSTIATSPGRSTPMATTTAKTSRPAIQVAAGQLG
jgi:hypothetical protein